MATEHAVQMDAIEITELLQSQETGVLSLADGDDAYGLPVSFVFKPEDQRVYFRFGFAPGSQKRKFFEATDHASFSVYDQTPEGWKSVVASGRLTELSTDSLDASVVQAVEKLQIPYFKVFDRPATDLEFSVVRLDVDSLSGIAEAGH